MVNKMYLYLTEFLGKAIYLYILCVAFADGKREVDISVTGDTVVQTNTTTYTIYNPYEGSRIRFTISCLSFLGVPSTVYLLKNGTILNDTFAQSTHTKHTLITQFTYFTHNEHDVAHLQGVYTCGFNFSLSTRNGSQFEYLMESEVEINTTTVSKLCASSVGFWGYLKEKVTFLCGNSHHSLHANFSQAEQTLTSRYSLQVSLLESYATFRCVIRSYGEPPRNFCSHGFEVYQSLKINILPNSFTLNLHELEFSCNSTPPRLLYWELIGDEEKILSLNNIGDLPEADGINIEIMQRAGWSSLRISSSVEDNINLGIQKVVCYAYGTRVRSVAYVSHETILESTTTPIVDICTCPPQTTPLSFDYDAENATATFFSTNRNATEQENTNPMQESTTVRQFCDCDVSTNKQEDNNNHKETNNGKETDKEEEINKWMITAVCSLAIASFETLILVIIGIWTYRKCPTGYKKQSSKSGFTGDIISSETELHENPVYQSYDS